MIVVPSSKNNRCSVTIRLRPQKDHPAVCPVRCFQEYWRVRPDVPDSCLLLDSARVALGPKCINTYLKVLCGLLGLGSLSSHAFRSGGATWAAAQGWPDAVIRAHGRWASDAVVAYIRPV